MTTGRPTTRTRPPFGARLEKARTRRGLTQLALARLLGVNRSLVRYYERDARDPKIDFVRRCAAVLKTPLSRLLGAEPVPRSAEADGLDRFIRKLRKLDAGGQEFALRLFERQLPEIASERAKGKKHD